MIYFARIFSLVGVTVAVSGMAALALMMIPKIQDLLEAEIQELCGPILFSTSVGIAFLLMGQWWGNDLFKIRGKDSIFALKAGRGDTFPYPLDGSGHSRGGWDGDCGGGGLGD